MCAPPPPNLAVCFVRVSCSSSRVDWGRLFARKVRPPIDPMVLPGGAVERMPEASTENFDPRFTRMPLQSASIPIPRQQGAPAEEQDFLEDDKDMFGGFTFDPPASEIECASREQSVAEEC